MSRAQDRTKRVYRDKRARRKQRQRERTNKETVETVDLCNLLDILDTLDTLNLHNHQQVLVCARNVIGVGSLERVRSKHWAETAGTRGRVLAPADYPLCVLLYHAVVSEWFHRERTSDEEG